MLDHRILNFVLRSLQLHHLHLLLFLLNGYGCLSESFAVLLSETVGFGGELPRSLHLSLDSGGVQKALDQVVVLFRSEYFIEVVFVFAACHLHLFGAVAVAVSGHAFERMALEGILTGDAQVRGVGVPVGTVLLPSFMNEATLPLKPMGLRLPALLVLLFEE